MAQAPTTTTASNESKQNDNNEDDNTTESGAIDAKSQDDMKIYEDMNPLRCKSLKSHLRKQIRQYLRRLPLSEALTLYCDISGNDITQVWNEMKRRYHINMDEVYGQRTLVCIYPCTIIYYIFNFS
jgi:hypothetical protein